MFPLIVCNVDALPFNVNMRAREVLINHIGLAYDDVPFSKILDMVGSFSYQSAKITLVFSSVLL